MTEYCLSDMLSPSCGFCVKALHPVMQLDSMSVAALELNLGSQRNRLQDKEVL